MFDKIARLLGTKNIQEGDREILQHMQHTAETIDKMKQMKRTDGWKILEEELKDRLRQGLREKVEQDKELSAYLDVLATAETRSKEDILAEQINMFLPAE